MFHLHVTLLTHQSINELLPWMNQRLQGLSCNITSAPQPISSIHIEPKSALHALKWQLQSDTLNAVSLQQHIQQALRESGLEKIDCIVQTDSPWRTRKQLLCFDMDSTLIQAEVIDELAKVAGVGEQVAAITAAAMRGELDFNESFSARMALLKGFHKEALQEIATSLPIMPGAIQLFATLKHWGYKTAILSGGFDFFAKHLQEKLGVDYIHANVLDFDNQDTLTGQAIPPVVNGEKKAEYLTALAQKENVTLEQVIAVGDGANDLPMIQLAGLGVAYHAKPLVIEKAPYSVSHVDLRGVLHLLDIPERDWK